MASRERYRGDIGFDENRDFGPANRSRERAQDDYDDERRYPGEFGSSPEQFGRRRAGFAGYDREYEQDLTSRGYGYRSKPYGQNYDRSERQTGWNSFENTPGSEDYGRAGSRAEQSGWVSGSSGTYGEPTRFGREERPWGRDREYDSWRHKQMSQFDKDYQAYLEERQSRFNSEFDEWRKARLSATTDTGNPMMSPAQKAATAGTKDEKTH